VAWTFSFDSIFLMLMMRRVGTILSWAGRPPSVSAAYSPRPTWRASTLNAPGTVEQAQPHGLGTKTILDEALEDSPWQTINKGERLSPDVVS
jgi:hypothetical protein